MQLRREHRLQQVMPALRDLLADDSSSGRHLLVLTDDGDEILWPVGSREALLTGGPVPQFSADHLVHTHHNWACMAAPITDPAAGRLLGVLDVSGPLDTISADTLRMVRWAVR